MDWTKMDESELASVTAVALQAIYEVCRARKRFAVFNSPHEGISVIREEFEELWDEVKKRDHDKATMRKEAKHLDAMALRFSVDLT